MVIQCRPPRRWSPDSLSVTDSEAESVSKYSVHSSYTNNNNNSNRNSLDRYNEDTNSTSSASRKHRASDIIPPNSLSRTLSSSKLVDEPIKSPTFSGASNNSEQLLGNTHQRSKSTLNKSYRKSLKHQLQKQQLSKSEMDLMSPHATAKAFTRLVARSKAFFYIGKSIHNIYSWKNKMYSSLVCLFWICTC
jgi:hypothetical protein